MATRQGLWVRWGGLTLLLGLAPLRAPAAEMGGQDFNAPVYDAVIPGALGQALTDYRFIADRDWPAIRLLTAEPRDWRRFATLALPVENPEDTPFHLLLRIDDRPDANGDDRSLTGTLDVPAHAKGTIVLPLDAAPIGMRARPPRTGALPDELPVPLVSGSVDLSHVTALHVSGSRSPTERRLRLGNPTLRPGAAQPLGALADAFGQAIGGDWPEKVTSNADLARKLSQAEALTRQLASRAPPPVDRFGGMDAVTKLVSTGYFRVDRDGRRWSLVTPSGRRFFSLGVDAVVPWNPTIVAGRRALFAWMPEQGDPLSRFAPTDPDGNVQTLDVGAANLYRGLGPGWFNPWRERTLARLKSWGFNTLGNWSATDVTDAAAMPFVTMDEVSGEVAAVPMPGGRSLPDPFDPRFRPAAELLGVRMSAQYRDNAMLIGYFSGNEMPWGRDENPEQGLVAQVLWLGSESPAKRALIEMLKSRYASAPQAAVAWGMASATSWEELAARRIVWPVTQTPQMRRDTADFQSEFATRYFSTVAKALKGSDPHHLYLGTRFADAPAAVVGACATWCDVLSFNVYGASPRERAAAWSLFDKPVLIGEFHFGSTDRGSFWPGMVPVPTEAARGEAYAAYVAQAVEDPLIVGVHWFQYADEPLTGRPYDGENGHIGLVAVTDVPYGGFVTAVAAANRRAIEEVSRIRGPDLRGAQ